MQDTHIVFWILLLKTRPPYLSLGDHLMQVLEMIGNSPTKEPHQPVFQSSSCAVQQCLDILVAAWKSAGSSFSKRNCKHEFKPSTCTFDSFWRSIFTASLEAFQIAIKVSTVFYPGDLQIHHIANKIVHHIHSNIHLPLYEYIDPEKC